MTNHESRNGQSVFTYDVSGSESLSEGVVKAVSAVSNSVPVPDAADAGTGRALDPLYSVVDPDALDAVFRTTNSGTDRTVGEVTFAYHGHEITVHSENRIRVTRLEPKPGGMAD